MTDAAPLVSVCIPTYNGKKYLAECLGSVLAQTFTDFEVLICDDRSSDDTLDYARELAGGDKRFRFIPNPQRFGLVGNWNNCVRQARGEWIKFVFQDDSIAPTCIETLLAACRLHDKPFAFCERNLLFEEGTPDVLREWFIAHQQKVRIDRQDTSEVRPEQAIKALAQNMSLNIVGEPTATLIKKSVFEEIGGFDEALIQLCDSEFWFRIMVNYGAAFVPEELAVFRIHAGAATALNAGKRAYRKDILDPLAFRYRLAFAPQFRPMRNRQLSGESAFSLRIACAVWAGYGWRQARESRHSGDTLPEGIVAEWKSVAAHCPGLQSLAYLGTAAHLLKRAVRTLQRVAMSPVNSGLGVLKRAANPKHEIE